MSFTKNLRWLRCGGIWFLLSVLLALLESAPLAYPQRAQAARPNVVLIITDDQGYGDLGFHGNPKIHTPNLDRLARDSVQFQAFYVSPVCAPTRASLLTGRYNYRTGVTDTYLGRALLHPDETTLAELLSAAGYRTAIFGKWHLGDNYPLRAIDQGFQEALTLNGGGIGQPSDPPGGASYFDPLLFRKGRAARMKGYVSDVITDAALQFIERQRAQPFFTYLAFNAPHTPLEVPAPLYQKYKQMNLKPEDFPGAPALGGHPLPRNFDAEATAKIYGMVENIDWNVGRVLAKLDELKLAEKTIVIFLTDNGPQQPRYNAGMLRVKGTVNEGGIRVPFFMRWPKQFQAGRKVSNIAAHIDVTPTLLDLCGVKKPARVKFDGVSLQPLLRGAPERWADRTLFFQWHRGDAPQLYRSFAARTQRYKLVQPQGNGENPLPPRFDFQLYDMLADPLETRDLAAVQPQLVAQLKQAYEAWFKDVTSERDYATPARISLGSSKENPVRLTRQDWRGPQASWNAKGLGHWEVHVERAGRYEIVARLNKLDRPSRLHFSFISNNPQVNNPQANNPQANNPQADTPHANTSQANTPQADDLQANNPQANNPQVNSEVAAGATTAVIRSRFLSKGPGRLECYVTAGGESFGVRDLEVRRIR